MATGQFQHERHDMYNIDIEKTSDNQTTIWSSYIAESKNFFSHLHLCENDQAWNIRTSFRWT